MGTTPFNMFILTFIAFCAAAKHRRGKRHHAYGSYKSVWVPYFYDSDLCSDRIVSTRLFSREMQENEFKGWQLRQRCYIGPGGTRKNKGIAQFNRGSRAAYSKEEAARRCLNDDNCTGITCAKVDGVNHITKGYCSLRQGSPSLAGMISDSREDSFEKQCQTGFDWWWTRYAYHFPRTSKTALSTKLWADAENPMFAGSKLPDCKWN